MLLLTRPNIFFLTIPWHAAKDHLSPYHSLLPAQPCQAASTNMPTQRHTNRGCATTASDHINDATTTTSQPDKYPTCMSVFCPLCYRGKTAMYLLALVYTVHR